MPSHTTTKRQSRTAIDVLIPAIDKDLTTLPLVIDSVRKFVRHPIGQILIVAPNSPRIKSLCVRKNCRFINENTVLPITKAHIHYSSKKWDRSGWLFQQLLKMGGSKFISKKFYLVIDADTVLIRPHRFRSGNKQIFYCRNWSQPEYFTTYRKLLGTKAPRPSSFVTHYMLFEKSKLSKLKKKIASKHGTSWHSAIIRKINKTKQFAFSEYETYGNFLYAKNPKRVILKKALNKSLSMNARGLPKSKVAKLARKYRSLSFHKRKCYVRKAKK
ncbi:DUF6492 family protein [Paenibacillus agricola]|uniref:Glycosyl transferase family 2 n=1 Tax=Paenibacillus agricola TaxID=2716264 RepID=A0ABX0JCX7_9BACL|nr:DUF6492 family protein [Paenibacillus agricola]NHN32079.1 hypothetical protein [Paenibacillus agricola]